MSRRYPTKLLTKIACDSAVPGDKVRYLNDGEGLRLCVHPNGSKYWQLRYVLGGREGLYQVGGYPAMSLAEARDAAAAARKLVAQGRAPKVDRDVKKQAQIEQDRVTFAVVAADWLADSKRDWSDAHYERNDGMLRRILLPELGKLPVREITAQRLHGVLEATYKRIPTSARKARTIAEQVFSFAIHTHRAEHNPGAQLRGNKTLRKPTERHHKALAQADVGPFLRALANSQCTLQVKAALRLMLWTGLRDHSLRGAQWSEIDFGAAVWTVPATRMKATQRQRDGQPHEVEHHVPLPTQAIAELAALKRLTFAGKDSFVFANRTKSGYIAENTLTKTLHRLGFKVTAHGMRSLMTDSLRTAGYDSDVVERQLAHKDPNQVRAAYQRTKFFDRRVPMIQWWADWCEAQENGMTVAAAPAAEPVADSRAVPTATGKPKLTRVA